MTRRANEIGPKNIPNKMIPTIRFKMVDSTPPYNAGRSLSTFMKILLISWPNFPVGVDIILSCSMSNSFLITLVPCFICRLPFN